MTAEYLAHGGKIKVCPGFGQGSLAHYDNAERLSKFGQANAAKKRARRRAMIRWARGA